MSASSGPEPYRVGAVDKALHALQVLRERGPCAVSDVAVQVGVSRSTAHRLLGTMVGRGFVAQDPLTRNYLLGPFLTEMGVQPTAIAAIIERSRPYLAELSAEVRETVQLQVLEGNRCRFVAGIDGQQQLKTSVRVGSVLAAHATAGGKVLLAELSRNQVEALIAPGLPRYTSRTIADPAALQAELDGIRRRGYAVNHQESEEGIVAVAVALRGPTGGVVAAVSVSLPSVRAGADRIASIVAALHRTASRIGEDLD